MFLKSAIINRNRWAWSSFEMWNLKVPNQPIIMLHHVLIRCYLLVVKFIHRHFIWLILIWMKSGNYFFKSSRFGFGNTLASLYFKFYFNSVFPPSVRWNKIKWKVKLSQLSRKKGIKEIISQSHSFIDAQLCY